MLATLPLLIGGEKRLDVARLPVRIENGTARLRGVAPFMATLDAVDDPGHEHEAKVGNHDDGDGIPQSVSTEIEVYDRENRTGHDHESHREKDASRGTLPIRHHHGPPPFVTYAHVMVAPTYCVELRAGTQSRPWNRLLVCRAFSSAWKPCARRIWETQASASLGVFTSPQPAHDAQGGR